uniref:Uncharacterized protein n=1 Tax=Setaria italica TaxID=4555 RepID=K3Z249_SETIT
MKTCANGRVAQWKQHFSSISRSWVRLPVGANFRTG